MSFTSAPFEASYASTKAATLAGAAFVLSVLHQTVSEDSLMNQTVSGNPLSAQRHCLFHPVYSGKVILYLYIDLSSAEASKNQIVLPIVIHESALHLDIKRFIFHA